MASKGAGATAKAQTFTLERALNYKHRAQSFKSNLDRTNDLWLRHLTEAETLNGDDASYRVHLHGSDKFNDNKDKDTGSWFLTELSKCPDL